MLGGESAVAMDRRTREGAPSSLRRQRAGTTLCSTAPRNESEPNGVILRDSGSILRKSEWKFIGFPSISSRPVVVMAVSATAAHTRVHASGVEPVGGGLTCFKQCATTTTSFLRLKAAAVMA
ncbi:hypothetical protein VFPFJ_08473 [Purpureocillium lilacinum]|uniref:Uncharacterized protein n=2 Tax=Purpureocillium lilacinum TaxID=33203 RepID=A0A179GZI6_PURLI|nr:hypothetical protein VFPFJ_08473 [Purpureocillium lilacinum]OAQ82670.1 hypothetical protein VFPFJ_08473 [Purpureocillium lilacinum]